LVSRRSSSASPLDLKPENILLVSANSDVDVKLTDFGLAKAADEGLKTFCGTPQYFAPEVLRRRHTVAGRGRYGKQADMWSLGVILYVLLSGTPPFSADEMLVSEVSTNITFPAEHWEGISEEAKDLILRLLVTDPRQRLAVTAACEHAWILQPDGDSHVHPLDDPQIQRVQQRLFASPHTLSQDEKAVLAASVGDHSRRSAEKEGLVSDAPQRQDESKFPEEKEHQPCGDQPREATSSLSVAKPAPDNSVEQKKQPGKGLDFALTAASTPEPDRSPATAGSPTEVAAAQGERGKGQAEHSEVVPGAKKEADQDGPPRSRSSLRSQNAVESRRPLSPVSLNDSLQDTGLGPSRDSGGAPADALASPTAVTPSASNARRFEPVTESRVTSLELNDDEVMSEFSQQTDSIDSFASMAPPEASDIIETNQKLKDARPATTDDAESANPSSEGGKRAEKPAAAKKKSKKKQVRSKGTNKESTDSSKSSRGKKRSGGSSAKTKGGSKKQKTSLSPGKQTGGKQTTLADWFKKSS
jgi:serine/threonine protein kinase